MHAADDGLEVVDVERPWIEVSIPSHDIDRMVVERDLVQAVVLLHDERVVAFLVDGLDVRRTANVALGVRRAFLELPELVAIALGPADVSATLEDEKLVIGLLVHHEAVQDPPMDDEVIALTIWQQPVRRFERPASLADVD